MTAHKPFKKSGNGPALWLSFSLCAAMLACHDDSPSPLFGHWDDIGDAGLRADAALRLDQSVSLDAATTTCSPAVIGHGLAALSAHRSPSRRTTPTAGNTDDDEEEDVIADPRCASGYRWVGKDHESKLMRPGTDCLACHRPENEDDRDDDDEAPGFVVAGTVYGARNEPDNCLGSEGAVIRITDANGQRIERVSNRAGNFYIKSKNTRLALPFMAEVSANGRTRAMQHAQCRTSCNVCHTATGTQGAPGRIVMP